MLIFSSITFIIFYLLRRGRIIKLTYYYVVEIFKQREMWRIYNVWLFLTNSKKWELFTNIILGSWKLPFWLLWLVEITKLQIISKNYHLEDGYAQIFIFWEIGWFHSKSIRILDIISKIKIELLWEHCNIFHWNQKFRPRIFWGCSFVFWTLLTLFDVNPAK